MDRITVTGTIEGATPSQLAAAWLDATGHAAMTGAAATSDGARFTAWDGYISGETLSAGPPIVQRWRSLDFPADAPDSRVEIHLSAVPGGCELRIEHSEIPDGQGVNYQTGWVDFYLQPIQAWARRPRG